MVSILIFNILLLSFPDFQAQKSISVSDARKKYDSTHIMIKETPKNEWVKYIFEGDKLVETADKIGLIGKHGIYDRADNIYFCHVRYVENRKDKNGREQVYYEILDWYYVQPIKRMGLNYIPFLPDNYKTIFERIYLENNLKISLLKDEKR